MAILINIQIKSLMHISEYIGQKGNRKNNQEDIKIIQAKMVLPPELVIERHCQMLASFLR